MLIKIIKIKNSQYTCGQQTGYGVFYYLDGGVYKGSWKSGRKHGQGEFSWPTGSNYVGQFQDGVMNGQGVLTKADGRKIHGVWKHGELLKKEYSGEFGVCDCLYAGCS